MQDEIYSETAAGGGCVSSRDSSGMAIKSTYSLEGFEGGLFEVVYRDGKLIKPHSFSEIRNRLGFNSMRSNDCLPRGSVTKIEQSDIFGNDE